MDRRTFLRGAVVAASTPAIVMAPTYANAQERYDAAVQELEVAARELFPDIVRLHIKTCRDEGNVCRMIVAGFNFGT